MSKLTTDYLYKRSDNYQIQIIIDDLIKTIDRCILDAHKLGKAEITYELLENFSIQNMERCDAQLVIYTKLIENYEHRGFHVKLKMNEDGSYLIIKWPSSLDSEEKKRMKSILSKHLI